MRVESSPRPLPRWHMAAWTEEIGASLLSRRLGGIRILLYRTRDGQITAMDDRCPHRFAPLSLGQRVGDNVHCGYHGLGFNANGECIHNPFSDRIPRDSKVRTYPVVERDNVAWIWLSDPSLASSTDMPDFSFMSQTPANFQMRGYTLMSANFEYGTDNLMDLSHIEFVHRGSFAGQGVIFAGKHNVRQEHETLHSDWWMPDVAPPGHTMGQYPPDAKTDHWLDMRWNAPASMYLQIGATLVGEPREKGIIVHQAHILTPETEGTTHYFWCTSTALPLDDPHIAASVKALFDQAFNDEDKPMIQAAYANAGGKDFWERKPVFLGIDAGGARARRLLEQIRRGQNAADSAADSERVSNA
jgi:phenylpropionate dioxygenase-like ring-hydroxylating dioxygenase large terminal subunit